MTAHPATRPPGNAIGWVLYDDSCGVCRTWVPRWKSLLRKRQLDVAALQENWVMASSTLSDEERMRDIQLLFRDGTQISGADVYRYVMKRTWWLWPLWTLSVIPIGNRLFDYCYRKVADNRHKISQVCRLS